MRWRLRITRMHLIQATVLLVVVLMSWGKRMGTSLMSPLKSTLKQELDINNTQWASLISMVWVVGTVSPFIAGLFIDTMGTPLAGAVSIALILLGNGMCAVAVGTQKLGIFLLGRAIYSMGGGAVFLVGEVIMMKWFKGRQLPLAFGCASTIGGLMAFSGPAIVTTVLTKHSNITIPFWIATGLSAFGLGCFGVYALIHYSHYSTDIEQTHKDIPGMEKEKDLGDNNTTSSVLCSDSKKPIRLPSNGTIELEIVHSQESAIYPIDAQIMEIEDISRSDTQADSCSKDGDEALSAGRRGVWARTKRLFFGIAALPESYWLVLLCISVQGTLFIPLHEVVPEMMETEWGYTRAESSKIFVYLHAVPIILHITVGIFINRIGHRLSLFLAGSFLVCLASVFVAFVRRIPIILSLVMINFSGSIVPASIFSLMNLVIDNNEVAGAALGLIRSAEFASVTLMEMLDGLLQDADHNRYDTVLIGLVAFACFLLFVSIASLAFDHMYNSGLLNSANPYVETIEELGSNPRVTDKASISKDKRNMSEELDSDALPLKSLVNDRSDITKVNDYVVVANTASAHMYGLARWIFVHELATHK
ncbi:hypothetical protein EV178_003263 [Coemansia sp. RSA 1646]|nr:hypothetical protein EV178_003263 [Coemansia sp. RSA 1646]